MNYFFILLQILLINIGFVLFYLIIINKGNALKINIALIFGSFMPILLTACYLLNVLLNIKIIEFVIITLEAYIFVLIFWGILKKNKESNYSIFNDMNEGILIVNEDFKYIYANSNALKILGNYISEKEKSDKKQIEELFVYSGNVIKYKEHNYQLKISEMHNQKKMMYVAWLLDVTEFVEHSKEALELKESAESATKAKDDFLANMSHEIRTPMNAIFGMSQLLAEADISPVERDYVETIKTASNNLLKIINDILDFSKIESGKIELIESEYSMKSLIQGVDDVIASRADNSRLTFSIYINPNMPESFCGDEKRIKQILINILNNAVKFTKEGGVSLEISYSMLDKEYSEVEFKVKDTGIGIKAADINKVFEKFTQVDTKKNRNVEGTGLGLPLSKKFAQMMDGDITVESEYGKGSCFTVKIKQKICSQKGVFDKSKISVYHFIICTSNKYYKNYFINIFNSISADFDVIDSVDKIAVCENNNLKNIVLCDYEPQNSNFTVNADTKIIFMINFHDRVEDEREDAKYVKKPIHLLKINDIINGGQINNNKNVIDFQAPDAKVVIVDDNEVNLKVAFGLMKKFGFEPELLSSGYDLLNNLRKDAQYDLIFVDHMMPGIDGVETVKLTRKIPKDSIQNTPIIALTANAIKGVEKEFKEAGMNDVLYKPILMEELKKILEKYLPKEKILHDSVMKMYKAQEENIPIIEGLDVENALNLIGGSLVDYEQILYNFYKSIDKKIDIIKRYVKNGDIKNYTIEVHGLKSASKLIGATEVSKFAAFLEKSGKEQNKYVVNNKTEEFLDMLRKCKHIIYPYITAELDVENKNEKVSLEIIISDLNELKKYIDEYDITGTDDVMKRLKGYKLNDNCKEILKALDEAIDNVAFDECDNLIEKFRANIK